MSNKNKTKQVETKKKKGWLIFTLCFVGTAFVTLVILGQTLFASALNSSTFFQGTTINGVDVSGMTAKEATNIISTDLVSARDEINITLWSGEKSWTLAGSDFEVNNRIAPIVENAYSYGRLGTFMERRKNIKDMKKNGFAVTISYRYILGGLEEKVDSILLGIETPAEDARINFDANKSNPVTIIPEKVGVSCNKEELFSNIDSALCLAKNVNCEIPLEKVVPSVTAKSLEGTISRRSNFSTSYKSSSSARKKNVKKALSVFNGKKIEAGEEVSFNETTGSRTSENGYQKANVILGGVLVEGTGGGVCQASTTLYNALILSGVEILEANKHSLPVSYVPLARDAMVSEGYSDLKFKNNLDTPLYIKTWGDDEKCYVEIYGKTLEKGESYKPRTNFISTLPHNGDVIVRDTEGKYADKVTYEGEYFRLKTPQEGYESELYLDYYKDDTLISSVLLRHEVYEPQQGVIIEGSEKPIEGITIPENTVKFIPPQSAKNQDEKTAENKIKEKFPSSYNP